MTTCNGYSNYETWATNLWIDNDYELQRYFSQVATNYNQEILDGTSEESDCLYNLSQQIREMIEDSNPLLNQTATLFTDLIQAALDSVNWREIAENFLEANTVE